MSLDVAFGTSLQRPMTTKNDKLITSNLTNTTIKLEQRKDLKNARNQKKKKKKKTSQKTNVVLI
jgi:hypothetical protein